MINDCKYVLGKSKTYDELNLNPEIPEEMKGLHAWIEIGDEVYDPVLMFAADKQEYYDDLGVISTEKIKGKDMGLYLQGLTSDPPQDYFDKIRAYLLSSYINYFLSYDKYIYGKYLRKDFLTYTYSDIYLDQEKCAKEFFLKNYGDEKISKIKNAEKIIAEIFSNKDNKYPGELAEFQNFLGIYFSRHIKVLDGANLIDDDKKIPSEKIESELKTLRESLELQKNAKEKNG